MRLAIISRKGMEYIAKDYLKGLTIEEAIETSLVTGYKILYKKQPISLPRFATYKQQIENKSNKLIEIIGPYPNIPEQIVLPDKKNKKFSRNEYCQYRLSALDTGVYITEQKEYDRDNKTYQHLRDFTYSYNKKITQIAIEKTIPPFLEHIKEFGSIIDSTIITFGSEKCKNKIIETLDKLGLEKA